MPAPALEPASVPARLGAARVALAALALVAGGIMLSRHADLPPAALFGVGAGCAGAALLLRGRWGWGALSAAVLLASAGWTETRLDRLRPLDPRVVLALPDPLPEPGVPIALEGIALGPAEPIARRGALARYAIAAPGRRAEVSLRRVERPDGSWAPARGRALLVLPEGDAALAPGAVVRVRGRLLPIEPRLNPGEPDWRAWAAQSGRIGIVRTHPDLVEPAGARGGLERAQAWSVSARGWMRARAQRALDDATPDDAGGAIVRAMVLGAQDPGLEEVRGAFERTGVAHLLAISGFHLVVMTALVVGAVRLTGDRGRLEPILAAALIVLYLAILPVRPPVWRAGLMALALLASMGAGRRYEPIAVLGWVSTALLIWRPMDLFAVGFLLSVVVTAGLILLATPAHARLWGDPRLRPPPAPGGVAPALRRTLAERTRLAVSVNLVAWAIATPIVAAGVGVVSPLGVAATVLVTPVVTLLLGLGYAALGLGVLVPGVGAMLEPAVGAIAGAVVWIVRLADALPMAHLPAPPVGAAWAGLGVLVAALLLLGVPRRLALPATAALVLWGAAEWWGRGGVGRALRVDMLAMGDGSALLLRSGRDALLWDCGSMAPAAGLDTVPRALRALGATRVPTAIITHADFDHFSALPDAAPRIGLRRVLLGPTVVEQAAADPDGASGALVRALRARGVEILEASPGTIVPLGHATVRIIGPVPGLDLAADNDRSLVAIAEMPAEDGPRRVLLTGDIGPEAIGATSLVLPSVDAMELPHHGSVNTDAQALIRALDPAFVLQSTGPRRVGDPRWDAQRAGRWWGVTARDGALWVRLPARGEPSAGSLRYPP